MKIEEAIKILLPASKEATFLHSHDFVFAVRLGVEALKRVKKARHYKHNLTQVLLPGETED